MELRFRSFGSRVHGFPSTALSGLRPTAKKMTVGSAAVFAPRSFGESQPSADWDWVWVTLGSPKRHPRETQASRMGHARIDFGFGLCFQQKLEEGRVGWCLAEGAQAEGCKNRRNRKAKTSPWRRGGAETWRKAKIGHRQECLCHRVSKIARDRKGKTSPLINTDKALLETRK
jgi:hypothetical protein